MDFMVNAMIKSLNDTELNQCKEEQFISFILCKNLDGLCETGQAILNDIKNVEEFPSYSTLDLCKQFLKNLYSDKLFIEDPEYGDKPNWDEIENFDEIKSNVACKIYRSIKENVLANEEIEKSINNKDKKFFVENFDDIFADLPFKENLNKFKNFISSDYITDEDIDIIWEYFESMLYFFKEEETIIKEIKDI